MNDKFILKELIKNIDNEINVDESIEQINLMACECTYLDEKIIKIIDGDILNKVEVLNFIAVNFYKNKIFDSVLPLLNKAINYDEKNDNTLYNLGFILKQFGEEELALKYFNKIYNKDTEVLNFIDEIKINISKSNGYQNRKTKQGKMVILDETFPNMASGFRIAEYSSYLRQYENCEVYSATGLFDEYKKEYSKYYPELIDRVKKFDTKYDFSSSSLFYMIFLRIAYMFLPLIEYYKKPFIFTLYAGGDFYLNDKESDMKLRKVCNSPYLKKIIVNQKITYEYLVNNNFVSEDKIEYVFGGVNQQDYWNQNLKLKKYYKKDKETFDICFVAYKYIDKGANKGYDTFIEVAKELAKFSDDIRFHVVGGFDENEIDVEEIRDKITFYGRQYQEFFPEFYSRMDVLLSLERPFLLHPGNFGGFPTGSTVQTALNGVAVFGRDILKQNDMFTDGEDIIILPDSVEEMILIIIYYYNNLDCLYMLSEKCRKKFEEVFSMKNQMGKRIDILNEFL